MSLLSRLLGLSALDLVYETARGDGCSAPFSRRALSALDISVNARDLDAVPRTGPLLVVANHPHGAVDGLALLSSVHNVRRDVRVLATHMLARIPEMHDECFFVDPSGGAESAARSRAGLRAAHLWLRGGGALIVFPSGDRASAAACSTRARSSVPAR